MALYGLGLELPPVKAKRCRDDGLSHEEWRAVYDRLGNEFGEEDGYWLVFEPYSPGDHEARYATLSDDLADVYRDLKDGLNNLARGSKEEAVFWGWRLMFRHHWGRHAASAINALHSILFGEHRAVDDD